MSYKTYEVTVYDDGDKYWRLNGKLHREDGPAIERFSGTKHWYLNGQRHREDGPAVERADGKKYWYLNNVEYTETEWRKKLNQKDTCDGEVVEVKGQKYKLVAVKE